MFLPPTWLARASGRDSLNGWNLESSSTPEPDLEPDLYLGRRPPDKQADVLSRLGVSHVVTTGDPFADALAMLDRFELVWREPPIGIFAVPFPPRAAQPRRARRHRRPCVGATSAPADPERLRIRVDASVATRATVAVAWSPKWHGRIDGRPVELGHTADGLIAVRLPAGRSALELDYGPDGWDRLGVGLSALTLVLLAAFGVHTARRRRQLKSASSSPPRRRRLCRPSPHSPSLRGRQSTSRSFSRMA